MWESFIPMTLLELIKDQYGAEDETAQYVSRGHQAWRCQRQLREFPLGTRI